jgi:hypothetical protein
MRYEVTLKGGSLSGPLLREEYLPGVVYHFSEDDSEYVNDVLFVDGHFDIKEIEDAPKAEPSEVEAKESTPSEPSKPEAKPKAKGGK